MSESSIANVKASVLTYDKESKQWVPEGPGKGMAKVQLYFHSGTGAYRVVARNLQDKQVIAINTMLNKGTLYHIATPTFHQWRDSRKVYGLRFSAQGDADEFANHITSAITELQGSAGGGGKEAPQAPMARSISAPAAPAVPTSPVRKASADSVPTPPPIPTGGIPDLSAVTLKAPVAVSTPKPAAPPPSKPKLSLQDEMAAKLQRRRERADSADSTMEVAKKPPAPATPTKAPPVVPSKKPFGTPEVKRKPFAAAPPTPSSSLAASTKQISGANAAAPSFDFDALKESILKGVETQLQDFTDNLLKGVADEIERHRPASASHA